MRQEIVFQFIGAIPTRPVGIFELIPKIPCEAWRVFSFSPQKVRWASRHRSFVWFLPYVNELWNKISLWSGWSLFLLWSRFHRQNGFLHLKCDPITSVVTSCCFVVWVTHIKICCTVVLWWFNGIGLQNHIHYILLSLLNMSGYVDFSLFLNFKVRIIIQPLWSRHQRFPKRSYSLLQKLDK